MQRNPAGETPRTRVDAGQATENSPRISARTVRAEGLRALPYGGNALTDGSLEERFKAGDGTALEQLMDAQSKRIARIVWRLSGWPEEVDDMVQEVFAIAWEKRARFRGGSPIEAWLSGIAVRVARRAGRRGLFRRPPWEASSTAFLSGPIGWAEPATEQGADAEVLAAERSAGLRGAIGRLRPNDREVLVLCYLEGFELSDVAKMLGIHRGALDTRLSRARVRLEALLEQEDWDA